MTARRRTFPAVIAASLALAALLVHAVLLPHHGLTLATRAVSATLNVASMPICGPQRDGGSVPAPSPQSDCPICVNAVATIFPPVTPLALGHPSRMVGVVVWANRAPAAQGTRGAVLRNRGPPETA